MFEGQYLTYGEYQELGGTLDETPFNLLEFEARKKIDERTLKRLDGIDTESIPDEVKICVFKLINRIFEYSKTVVEASNNVASENIDGYSVSYLTPDRIAEIIESKNDELDNLIMTNLFGVIVNGEHLIYLGVK
jgi:hypothetical protein